MRWEPKARGEGVTETLLAVVERDRDRP
jgi:hypothetical protein